MRGPRARHRPLSRPRGRRRAGRGRKLVAGRRIRSGVSVGAPPDPFSVQGQKWSLPAPNPWPPQARAGGASPSALPRQHAPRGHAAHRPCNGAAAALRDPCGAKPAEGAYLSYPVEDLIGQITLESQRADAWCRRGPRHGARRVPRPDNPRQYPGMRVLRFERDGLSPVPANYPGAVGRLRRHARSGDAGRLVARSRHRREAHARVVGPGRGRRAVAARPRRGEPRNAFAAGSSARRQARKRRSPMRSRRRSTPSWGRGLDAG